MRNFGLTAGWAEIEDEKGDLLEELGSCFNVEVVDANGNMVTSISGSDEFGITVYNIKEASLKEGVATVRLHHVFVPEPYKIGDPHVNHLINIHAGNAGHVVDDKD